MPQLLRLRLLAAVSCLPATMLAAAPAAAHPHVFVDGHLRLNTEHTRELTTSIADPTGPRHGVDCACIGALELARAGGPATSVQIAAAVASIGIRPCSGALIVLVFALSQNLYPVGVVSVLAMAAGTGMTVAAVALLTGTTRNWLSRFAHSGSVWSARVSALVQLGAAALIFLFGAMMTTGALAAGGVVPL